MKVETGFVRRLFEGSVDAVGDIHGELDALRSERGSLVETYERFEEHKRGVHRFVGQLGAMRLPERQLVVTA